MQTIKTWYKYAPDILGKKLQQRKKLGGVIPEKQRQVSCVIEPTARAQQFCVDTSVIPFLLGCQSTWTLPAEDYPSYTAAYNTSYFVCTPRP